MSEVTTSELPEMISEKVEEHWPEHRIYPWGKKPWIAYIRIFKPWNLESDARRYDPAVIDYQTSRLNIEEAERLRDALTQAIEIAKEMNGDAA